MKVSVKKLFGKIIACIVIASIGLISVNAESPTVPSEPTTNEVIDLTGKSDDVPSEDESNTEPPASDYYDDENPTELPENAIYDNDSNHYYTVENGEATIVKGPTDYLKVTIPADLGGYPVVRIGKNAYTEIYLDYYIIIPKSVRVIESNAFDGAHLTGDILIFGELKSIGLDAFKDTNISTVYYAGTESEFNNLKIAPGNESFTNAERYNKYEMSKAMFLNSISSFFSNVGFFFLTLFMPLIAPLLLIIPPLGVSSFLAPIGGIAKIFIGFGESATMFFDAIEILFE